MGLVSLFLALLPWLGLVLAPGYFGTKSLFASAISWIISLITGVIAVIYNRQSKATKSTNRYAISGITISLLSLILFALMPLINLAVTAPSREQYLSELKIKANELAQELFIVDAHQDVPYRLQQKYEDISKSTSGNFDYPRARKGGLDAVFMAAYVPAGDEEKRIAKAHAEMQINMVKHFAEKYPDKFETASSVAELRAQPVDEKVSFIHRLCP